MIGLHLVSRAAQPAIPESVCETRVALAGNPNAGKTSIFNALTGARQRVGNYPGVTVERRAGRYAHDGANVELVDLPGVYSLSSATAEERIAQEELLSGGFDVVVVVVDSSTLKRSLVLLAQVMQMGARCVLCLNMSDEAEAAGQRLDLAQMRALLGMPIVQTVGHRADGIASLRQAIVEAAGRSRRRSGSSSVTGWNAPCAHCPTRYGAPTCLPRESLAGRPSTRGRRARGADARGGRCGR